MALLLQYFVHYLIDIQLAISFWLGFLDWRLVLYIGLVLVFRFVAIALLVKHFGRGDLVLALSLWSLLFLDILDLGRRLFQAAILWR